MTDKLALIRMILDTDAETDRKILDIIQGTGQTPGPSQKIILEERVAERKNIIMDVDLNTDNEKIYAETENISSSGVFIKTSKTIGRGEDLAIKLIAPDGDEFGFLAEVARVNNTGIGVRIKSISKMSHAKILKYMEQL